MEALRCNAATGELKLTAVSKPQVTDPEDVLIQVGYAGLCGTDLHIMSGEFSVVGDKPVTISHEFAGTVVGVGEVAARRFKLGDRVGVDPNLPCHQCQFCVRGQVHFCQDAGCRDATGIFRDGGCAELCKVPAEQVFVLPSSVTLMTGALCEPLSCLLHGWDRLRNACLLQPDHRVLITGAGIIGNLWLSLLHHHGCRNLTVSEPAEGRRQITKGLDTGAIVISPDELEKEEDSKNSDLDGFDVIIECSGYPPALEQAMSWTKRGCTVLIFGCAPPGKTFSVSPEEIFRKELTILGSLINPHTYARAVELAASLGERYLSYEKLGVQVFKLTDYQRAIEKLQKGDIAKAVFSLAQ